MDTITLISFVITLVVGIVSIVLAGFAIWFAKSAERDSKDNFQRTQAMMLEQHERTKDVLAEVDKRASIIETTVAQSQQQLLNTVTGLLQQMVAPAKPGADEQVGMMFFEELMKDPKNMAEVMAAMQPFIQMSQNQPNQTPPTQTPRDS